LIDSHVKLKSLDDRQELSNISHHKLAFNYDEDTMSLVKDSTLTTLEIPLSDDSAFSAGNAPIAFEYYCYDIEADSPQLNYHGPKIMIPKQESPVTICTAYKIGTIHCQRLFQVLFDCLAKRCYH
jgi:hypothetical protein